MTNYIRYARKIISVTEYITNHPERNSVWIQADTGGTRRIIDAVREELEELGEIEKLEKRLKKNGTWYPAKYKASYKTAEERYKEIKLKRERFINEAINLYGMTPVYDKANRVYQVKCTRCQKSYAPQNQIWQKKHHARCAIA